MPRTKAFHRIVWALDAFEPRSALQARSEGALGQLAASLSAEVHPVYVLTPGQVNLSVEFTPPWIEQYRPAAERALKQRIGETRIPRLCPPKVLVEDLASTTRAVDALIRHAQRIHADLIVVGTHGRSGVRRLFMGSFAETLLLRSPIPCMTLGPKVRETGKFDTILFPTVFDDASSRAFRQVIALARDLKARILLFHAIPHLIEPVFQSGVYLLGGAWVPVQAYFSNEVAIRENYAEAWAHLARKQGVETTAIVEPQVPNIADSILKLAEDRDAGLLCMEARSGPVAASLIGSITRQIIRAAPVPVWVLKPPVSTWASIFRRAA